MRSPRCLRRIAAPLAVAALCACGDPEPRVSYAPPRLSDGWAVSTPAAQGMDSAVLAGAFRRVARGRDFGNATSLLVVRNGALVAEGYFRGGGRARLNDVRSVAKSVTSLLVGMAIEDGAIRGVRQPLADFLPAYLGPGADPRKRSITLDDLLTMRSGLAWSEHTHGDADPLGMYGAPNSVRWVLAQHPAVEAPGRVFEYSTGDSQLLSAAVQAATGQRLSEMARARLFAPLGITGERWDAHRDGTTYGGVRLYLTARDMARLGELCLQGGAWNGRQIVPAAWIAAATAPHSTSPEGPYGYHWWVRPLGYTAQGFGGQYIFVIPRHRLVVVMTADPDAGRHIGFGPMERLISETILRAIRPAPAR